MILQLYGIFQGPCAHQCYCTGEVANCSSWPPVKPRHCQQQRLHPSGPSGTKWGWRFPSGGTPSPQVKGGYIRYLQNTPYQFLAEQHHLNVNVWLKLHLMICVVQMLYVVFLLTVCLYVQILSTPYLNVSRLFQNGNTARIVSFTHSSAL